LQQNDFIDVRWKVNEKCTYAYCITMCLMCG